MKTPLLAGLLFLPLFTVQGASHDDPKAPSKERSEAATPQAFESYVESHKSPWNCKAGLVSNAYWALLDYFQKAPTEISNTQSISGKGEFDKWRKNGRSIPGAEELFYRYPFADFAPELTFHILSALRNKDQTTSGALYAEATHNLLPTFRKDSLQLLIASLYYSVGKTVEGAKLLEGLKNKTQIIGGEEKTYKDLLALMESTVPKGTLGRVTPFSQKVLQAVLNTEHPEHPSAMNALRFFSPNRLAALSDLAVEDLPGVCYPQSTEELRHGDSQKVNSAAWNKLIRGFFPHLPKDAKLQSGEISAGYPLLEDWLDKAGKEGVELLKDQLLNSKERNRRLIALDYLMKSAYASPAEKMQTLAAGLEKAENPDLRFELFRNAAFYKSPEDIFKIQLGDWKNTPPSELAMNGYSALMKILRHPDGSEATAKARKTLAETVTKIAKEKGIDQAVALWALGGMGKENTPALLQILNATNSDETRKAVFVGFDEMQHSPPEIVLPLVETLPKVDERSRPRLLSAIARAGADALPALPQILPLLPTNGEFGTAIHVSAAGAIKAMGPKAVTELLNYVQSPEQGKQDLGWAGLRAVAHTPELTRFLINQVKSVDGTAKEKAASLLTAGPALSPIEASEIYPVFKALPTSREKFDLANTLSHASLNAEQKNALRDFWKKENPYSEPNFAHELTLDREATIQALRKEAKTETDEGKPLYETVEKIAELGNGAKEFQNYLKAAMTSPDLYTAGLAFRTLRKIPGGARSAQKEATQILADPHSKLHTDAAELLADANVHNPAAGARIKELILNGRPEDNHRITAHSLARIAPLEAIDLLCSKVSGEIKDRVGVGLLKARIKPGKEANAAAKALLLAMGRDDKFSPWNYKSSLHLLAQTSAPTLLQNLPPDNMPVRIAAFGHILEAWSSGTSAANLLSLRKAIDQTQFSDEERRDIERGYNAAFVRTTQAQ